jgi:hypothetical protein
MAGTSGGGTTADVLVNDLGPIKHASDRDTNEMVRPIARTDLDAVAMRCSAAAHDELSPSLEGDKDATAAGQSPIRILHSFFTTDCFLGHIGDDCDVLLVTLLCLLPAPLVPVLYNLARNTIRDTSRCQIFWGLSWSTSLIFLPFSVIKNHLERHNRRVEIGRQQNESSLMKPNFPLKFCTANFNPPPFTRFIEPRYSFSSPPFPLTLVLSPRPSHMRRPFSFIY